LGLDTVNFLIMSGTLRWFGYVKHKDNADFDQVMYDSGDLLKMTAEIPREDMVGPRRYEKC